MNKKRSLLTCLLPCLLPIGIAYANAPTAELTVTGELTVPTCTVSATNDGVYDIGKLSPTTISATATTTLASLTNTWTVSCDADTFMNFTPIDNRSGTASTTGANNFGLGTVNDTGMIGFYTVTASNATVDGATSRLFTTASTSISAAATATLTPGSKTGWANASGTAAQLAGKLFSVDLVVTPVLASSTTMNGSITDDTEIDGSATLNFSYGI